LLIDTHTHINMDKFDNDREDVIQRARDAGIKIVLDVGTDLKSSQKAVENSERFKEVRAVVGIHPHEAVRAKEQDILEIERLLEHPNVVGIGEIGLDYYYNFSPEEIQKEIFSRQLYIAKEQKLPVVIHVRKAMKDTIEILDTVGDLPARGVFHCFGGTVEDVHRVLKMGFFISFTGIVTFHNFKNFDKIRQVPINKLLLETDSPYMTPVPHRGKRNEPCFLVHTARKLSEIYDTELNNLAGTTTKNAQALFKITI